MAVSTHLVMRRHGTIEPALISWNRALHDASTTGNAYGYDKYEYMDAVTRGGYTQTTSDMTIASHANTALDTQTFHSNRAIANCDLYPRSRVRASATLSGIISLTSAEGRSLPRRSQ